MNSTLELEGAAVAKVLEPVMRGLPPGVARVRLPSCGLIQSCKLGLMNSPIGAMRGC